MTPQEADHTDTPEVEHFSTQLVKDAQGLGITIAGYVGESPQDELSGIFVKSVTPDSAAATNGKIRVNDQIIEVSATSCSDHLLLYSQYILFIVNMQW